MRLATTLVLIGLVSLLATSAFADNEEATLVLHAYDGLFGPCNLADPCPNATTEVTTGQMISAYLMVRNFTTLIGVQTAFDWDASWSLLGAGWDCQVNQINGTVPTAPGARTGTIATVFDVVTGPAAANIGRMYFTVGTGCIVQIMSDFPDGNHVLNEQIEVHQIPEGRGCWGAVCVGAGGINACPACSPTPVLPTTWGSIKAQYN